MILDNDARATSGSGNEPVRRRGRPGRRLRAVGSAAIALLLVATGANAAPAAEASGAGTVTGLVVDEYSKPLNRITVQETVNYTQVSTNANGRFTLHVPAGVPVSLRFGDWDYWVYPSIYLGNTTSNIAAKQLTVGAGQSVSVGTIRLNSGLPKLRRSSTAIKTSSKAAVKKAYRAYRKAAPERVRYKFPKGCKAPITSAKSQRQTIAAVNYMRSMAGLDKVKLSPSFSKAARQSSLIQYYQRSLNHFPSENAKCATATGLEAAGRSNLAAGATAANAVRLYMRDYGAHNVAVGHRRAILDPEATKFGTGDVGRYNSLTVRASTISFVETGVHPNRARPRWVTWPTAGWFPVQEEPAGRWSVSAVRDDVSFDKARVTVRTSSGKKLKVKVKFRRDENLTFQISRLPQVKGKSTVRLKVTITGITQRAVTQPALTYTVKLFDPTK